MWGFSTVSFRSSMVRLDRALSRWYLICSVSTWPRVPRLHAFPLKSPNDYCLWTGPFIHAFLAQPLPHIRSSEQLAFLFIIRPISAFLQAFWSPLWQPPFISSDGSIYTRPHGSVPGPLFRHILTYCDPLSHQPRQQPLWLPRLCLWHLKVAVCSRVLVHIDHPRDTNACSIACCLLLEHTTNWKWKECSPSSRVFHTLDLVINLYLDLRSTQRGSGLFLLGLEPDPGHQHLRTR